MANPLEQLRAKIAEAATLPAAEPFVRATEPLRQLQALISGAPQPVDADAPAPATPRATMSAEPREVGAIDALVGREVLDLVGAQPLSAEAREEAVRRLVIAMQNPEAETLRSVLRVLVSNRVDV